jgi:hypothetical protein
MQSPSFSSSTGNLLGKTDVPSEQPTGTSSLSESQGSGADSSDNILAKRNTLNANAPLTPEMEEVFGSLERFLVDLDTANIGRATNEVFRFVSTDFCLA